MSGKWDRVGVPNQGWDFIGIEDLESPNQTCAMCEVQEIRYVHSMKHPDYPDVLKVGCVCAGQMQGNVERANKKEQAFKNANQRRKNWLSRKWQTSKKGNSYINTDGFHITIFQYGNIWKGIIKKDEGQKEKIIPSRKEYDSEDQAKLAAFDAMLLLKERDS